MSDGGDKTRATRQAQLDKQARSKLDTPMPRKFDMAVVGVSFTPYYPHNLWELETQAFDAEAKGEKLAAIIVRDPNNPYDANACQVHVPALGEAGFIGYITKPVAARLAPTIDNGVVWDGHVSYLKINPDHPERPGIEITLEAINT